MDISVILDLLSDPRVLAIVSPVLVAALKKAVASLPKWAMPLLSIVLGAAVSALAGGDVASGAGAGLAGIGVREVLDRSIKARQ